MIKLLLKPCGPLDGSQIKKSWFQVNLKRFECDTASVKSHNANGGALPPPKQNWASSCGADIEVNGCLQGSLNRFTFSTDLTPGRLTSSQGTAH